MEAVEQALKGRGSPSDIVARMEKEQLLLSAYQTQILEQIGRMAESFNTNRGIIVVKLDEILKALYERR